MAPMWSLIKDLDDSKTTWALKLRVVRLYERRYQNQPEPTSLECVLHDQEGLRIHATVKSRLFPTFQPLLKEGQLITLKNFVVTANAMPYKTTINKFSIEFLKRTHAYEFVDHLFPSFMFDFQQFPIFSKADILDQTRLFEDFIGKVVDPGLTRIIPSGGRETKIRGIILEDLEKNQLKCTLWEDFVDKFSSLIEIHKERPQILILQFFRGKLFRGTVSLCTAYNVSKMILNEDIPEINQLGETDDGNNFSEFPFSTPMSIVRPIPGKKSNEKEIRKTIGQLNKDQEAGVFWVFGEIIDVEAVGSTSWYYLSCKRCLRKISAQGDGFFCGKCNQSATTGNLRFRVKVRVFNETGSALFLLWDRECADLIGKTVTDLISQKEKESTVDVLPKEIEALVEKSLFFKVQVKPDQVNNFNGAYSVVKVAKDGRFLIKQEELSGKGEDIDDQESSCSKEKKVSKV